MDHLISTTNNITTIQYEGGILGAFVAIKAALGSELYAEFKALYMASKEDLFSFTQEENAEGNIWLQSKGFNFIWWC